MSKIPLQINVEEILKQYVSLYANDIKMCNSYIFFSLQHKGHVHEHNLRNSVFKKLRQLDINIKYGQSTDGRDLWLFSFHSLRGHAATRVFILSNYNKRIAQLLLDHSIGSKEIIDVYLASDWYELYRIMRQHDTFFDTLRNNI